MRKSNEINHEPVPNWLRPVVLSQMVLSVILALAGIGHIVAHGFLAYIGTGIYAGITLLITAIMQWWLLKKNDINNDITSTLSICKFFIALSLILCFVNTPLISILSIIMGDAFGYPHKSCRYFGPIADFSCIIVTQAPNVGALICDIILMLAGFGAGGLLIKSGIYFLPLTQYTATLFDNLV